MGALTSLGAWVLVNLSLRGLDTKVKENTNYSDVRFRLLQAENLELKS